MSEIALARARHREMLLAAAAARQVAAAERLRGRGGRRGRRSADPSSNHGAELLSRVHR